METYHALTPVAQPDPSSGGAADTLAIAPVLPPALATDAEPESSEPPAAVVNQTIEELAREGARRMLERALAVEVDEFLGRPRYERRMLAEHGYRNGYGRPRSVAIGTWPVEVRAPRIRDLPDDAPPFHSSILPRRRMLSAETQRLFARLYWRACRAATSSPPSASCWASTPPCRRAPSCASRRSGRPSTPPGGCGP